uniref:Uncharacterized protein n=1 Tax=Naja naja TaxID=35670 RepID=A0A8C6XVQ0_NAJNA
CHSISLRAVIRVVFDYKGVWGDLNGDVLQPRDRRTTTILILGFHAKEGQAGSWPTLPGKQVGAGPLEMEKKAVEGMVVRISKDHTRAALHRHTLEEFVLRLADFIRATGHLLAEEFIVEIQATALARIRGINEKINQARLEF